MPEPKRVALGLTLLREMDAVVALRWFELLRSYPWLGPTLNGRGQYTVQARNLVLEQAFARLDEWDSLLFWDADQLPPLYMPKHHDFPGGYFTEYVESLTEGVIGGLYYSREDDYDAAAGRFPHQPVAYYKGENEGYRYLSLEELHPMLRERGKYKVDGIGTGSLLIQKDVLLRLRDLKAPRPIFEAPAVPAASGKPGWQWTEDLYFCKEVTDMGEEVWLDAAMESGHRGDVWISTAIYLASRGVRSGPVPSDLPLREVYRVPILLPDGQPPKYR